MNKFWVFEGSPFKHTMECYLTIEKAWSLSFVTVWMDLEDIMLGEINQSEEKYHVISLMCGI